MGITTAQAILQSLVNEHTGVSYKEALEEIRAYIAEVQPNSLQQLKVAKSLLNNVSSYLHGDGHENTQLCLLIDEWLSATV
jgi:hypothetical protein